jgi:hypothetical protein
MVEMTRIVQIAISPGGKDSADIVYALTDLGEIYFIYTEGEEWRQLPPLPLKEVETKTDRRKGTSNV